ncbi:MAG: hypothetical protein ACTHJ0_06015, partial [Flavipsychrobacter sp.]
MKKLNNIILSACSTLLCLLALGYKVNAATQPSSNCFITPSSADRSGHSATFVNNINVDMFQFTNYGTKLNAIVWDDQTPFPSPTTINSYISLHYILTTSFGGFMPSIDTNLDSVLITLPLGASAPDVAIADDMSDPGNKYIVGVVYSLGINIFFDTYSVVPGVTTISVSPIASTHIAGGTNKTIQPHIDMFSDPGNYISGYPSLHEFAISWIEYNGSGLLPEINIATGDISTPSSFTTNTIATTTVGGVAPQMPDIAAATEVGTQNHFAYVTYTSGNDLDVAECSFGPSLTGIPTVNTRTLNTYVSVQYPRIEAMNVYNAGSVVTKWSVACQAKDIASGKWKIFEFGDSLGVITGNSISYPNHVPSLFDNYRPVVAAGVGPAAGIPPSDLGNSMYAIGWVLADWINPYLMENVSVDSNKIIDTCARSANYHQIRNVFPDPATGGTYGIGVYMGSQTSLMAATSTSNSGEDFFIAYFDGKEIQYRYTLFTHAF